MSDVYAGVGNQASQAKLLNRASDLKLTSNHDVAEDAGIQSHKLLSYVAKVVIPINTQYVMVRHSLDVVPRFVSTTRLDSATFPITHSVSNYNKDTVTLDFGAIGLGAPALIWVKVEA